MSSNAAAATTMPNYRRVIAAGVVGNVMEWYDFAVYGYFAVTIGHLFFPSSDPTVSLIGSLGAFAAGFLVRPLGGVVFGYVGDVFGRKAALTWSIMLMAVPTLALAFVPTYAQIGVAAPIIVILLRLLQGLSVGGEYSNSVLFLVEHAPPNRRSFFGCWGNWGSTLGFLIGSGVATFMTAVLSEAQMESWGWRIPFVCGIFVAFTGLMVRRVLHVNLVEATSDTPVRDTLTTHLGPILRLALLCIGYATVYYTAVTYSVDFVQEVAGLPQATALELNTILTVILLFLFPLGAMVADRIGQRNALVIGLAMATVLAVPMFALMQGGQPWVDLGAMVVLGISLCLIAGSMPPLFVNLIPTEVRTTGVAVATNLSAGLLGGTSPVIVATLIHLTGDTLAGGWWVTLSAGFTVAWAILMLWRWNPSAGRRAAG